MQDKLQLSVKIDIAGALAVGATPPVSNKFKLVITNQGATIRQPDDGNRFILYLAGTLGSSEADLFLDDIDARQSGIMVPKGWRADWKFSAKDKSIFAVQIYTFNDPILQQGAAPLTIEFSKIKSKTAPGQARLGFGTDLAQPLQPLIIEKDNPKPGIIALYSDPPTGTQNLPGQDVTLKWRTFQLIDRKLEEVGIPDPLPATFDADEGFYTVSGLSVGASFRLSGYGPELVRQDIATNVVSAGWHARPHTIRQGDPGYPQPADEDQAASLEKAYGANGLTLEPTEIVNADDDRLYGIFRYTFQDQETALLFQTSTAFGRWSLVETSVPGQQRAIPEGFSESSGVYFDDHLWLIGGSQIDPDNTSNLVWRLDTTKGTWENLGQADWTERMGHAVLVFQNQIWVMGGRDSAGNALNDIWKRNASSPKWTPVTEHAAWKPRCLFHPTVFKDQIWLYGGVKEPLSSDLYDDLYVYPSSNDSGGWEQLKLTDIIGDGSGKPVASCLQVFRNRIHLFGKFRRIGDTGSVDYLAFTLDPEIEDWESFPVEGLKGWGGVNTFSYQVLSFQGKFLIAKALGYDKTDISLRVYVPLTASELAAQGVFRK